MKVLTLVRHAKSSWDYAELSDFERPLNARGRRDAPAMAARAAKAGARPQRLVSSPALRAITTAHAFAQAFGVRLEDIEVAPRIYEATPQALLQVIRALATKDGEVMLFGHNPGVTQAAQMLAECPFEEMPTCAVARLELDVKAWTEVAAGCGRLKLYDFPKSGD